MAMHSPYPFRQSVQYIPAAFQPQRLGQCTGQAQTQLIYRALKQHWPKLNDQKANSRCAEAFLSAPIQPGHTLPAAELANWPTIGMLPVRKRPVCSARLSLPWASRLCGPSTPPSSMEIRLTIHLAALSSSFAASGIPSRPQMQAAA